MGNNLGVEIPAIVSIRKVCELCANYTEWQKNLKNYDHFVLLLLSRCNKSQSEPEDYQMINRDIFSHFDISSYCDNEKLSAATRLHDDASPRNVGFLSEILIFI